MWYLVEKTLEESEQKSVKTVSSSENVKEYGKPTMKNGEMLNSNQL